MIFARRGFLIVSAGLCTAMLAACSSVIPHESRTTFSRSEACAVITRAFEEQPANFRPVEISIDEEAIRLGFSLTRRSLVAGGVATVQRRETYYFSNLKSLEIISRKGRFQVRLSNKEGSVARWMIFYDQAKAGAFIDAVATLSQ